LQPNLWGKEHSNDDVFKFGNDGYGERIRLGRILRVSQNSYVIVLNRLWAGSLSLGSIPDKVKEHGFLTG
jgi:hypothetical protein